MIVFTLAVMFVCFVLAVVVATLKWRRDFWRRNNELATENAALRKRIMVLDPPPALTYRSLEDDAFCAGRNPITGALFESPPAERIGITHKRRSREA